MEQPNDIRSLFKFDAYTVRPASIVIKFNLHNRFEQSILFYKNLLGIEGTSSPSNSLEEYHVFQVGSQDAQVDKDIELRLVHRDKSGRKENHTVVYWCVPGENLNDLSLAHDKILRENKKYREIDPPTSDNSFFADSTVRSLIEDESGNQVGLLVIPPFPHGKSLENHRNKKSSFSNYLFPLAGAVASLALGPFLLGAILSFRQSRKSAY